MDFDQAIQERHSVRLYTEKKIEGDVLTSLQNEISRINKESGMSIRLVLNEPKAFGRFLLKTVVKFKNAVNYMVISGPESDTLNLDAGYYGEQLVLYAQTLGLGTCWAMMAGKKEADKDLPKGHKSVILISIGYPENPGVHAGWSQKCIFYTFYEPIWGVSDVNKVRMLFGSSTLAQIDAGIVKFHFEYGAGTESFVWAE